LAEPVWDPGTIATLEHRQPHEAFSDVSKQSQRAALAAQHGPYEQNSERLARDWHEWQLYGNLCAERHKGAADEHEDCVHRQRGVPKDCLGKGKGARSLHDSPLASPQE